MKKIISYAGKEPSVVPMEHQKEVLALMQKQLQIISCMTSSIVLIAEGTRLSDVTPAYMKVNQDDDQKGT